MQMRRLFFILSFLVMGISSYAVNLEMYEKLYPGCVDNEESTIYGGTYGAWPKNLILPEFPDGGDVEFTRFIYNNLTYPEVVEAYDSVSKKPILAKGVEETGLQIVFVRPKDSMHPTKEHMLFIFEPGRVWRTFLPKTCQFPLNLFEKKPAEWLSRCAKEFSPFKITAAFEPPTITRRMSHATREKVFKNAGYGEIDEYYHQILKDLPKGWKHPDVPDDCDLSGKSDVERDVRFNTLPIDTRLQLLNVLNVQDVLVSGWRSEISSDCAHNTQKSSIERPCN